MSAETVTRRRFTGWSDFIRTVSRPPSAEIQQRGRCASLHPGDKQWTLGVNYDQAIKLAMSGWPEGFKDISLKADAIGHATGGQQMTPRFSDSGDDIDVGLFLEREPECWMEYPMEARNAPVIKLIISATYNASTDADQVYNRGAAILAAIDLMEMRGLKVEVDLDLSFRSDGARYVQQVPLKSATDALDRDKLAFALCHPATLRRLEFRLHELDGLATWEAMGDSSYGRAVNPEPAEGALVVPSISSCRDDDFTTIAGATKYAEKLLAQVLEVVTVTA